MRYLLLLILIADPLLSTTVQQAPGSFSITYEMVPGAVPTSNTCLVGPISGCLIQTQSTPYVCEADFTATGQTITLEDGQPTPVVFINNTLGSTGSPTTWIFSAAGDSYCRSFPSGVYLQANGSGATGYLKIKWNK